MRTTITIDDELLAQVKQQAALSGRTVSQTIEDAVRMSLQSRMDEPAPRFVVVPFDGGGYQPGVDLDDNAALLDLMEDLG